MSKYSVGEREAAAHNVQLDLQWGKLDQESLPLYFVHWWAASTRLLLARASTGGTVRGACLSREGKGGAAAVKWLNLVFHLWVTPPSAKKIALLLSWLYLQSEFFSFHFSACCLRFRTFCLGCCPSSLVESKQILTRALLASGDVDAAQPTSITLQMALLVAVPPSPPGAGEGRKQLQALGESVCRGCLLFEACLWFPCLKCSVLAQLPAAYCPDS